MRLYFTILFLLYFRLEPSKSSLETDTRFLLKPHSLPDDLNFMPSLSNGHLGFTIFGDAIYMNGVYNGFKGNSRRARLPNWLNVTAHILNSETNTYFQHNNIEYAMNLYKGVYQWVEEYTNLKLVMKQRVYAHRYFNRALIFETIIRRKTATEPITIELQQNPGSNTQAFDVIPENCNLNTIKMIQATTKEVENKHFQPNCTRLYVAFSDSFQENKKTLKLNCGQRYLYYRFVLTADLEKSVALEEIEKVLSLPSRDLLEKHTTLWQEFWNEFQINVEDNMELVWSETKKGFQGSANFLTGIGGFLQTIVHGYGGIRFQLENNSSKMIIKQTYLMNNTKQLTIKGIKFANSSFELKIEKNGNNTLKLLKLGEHPLEIIIGADKATNLYEGFSIQFQTEFIIIQTITRVAERNNHLTN